MYTEQLTQLCIDVLNALFVDPLISFVVIVCVFNKYTRYMGFFLIGFILIFGWSRLWIGIIIAIWSLFMQSATNVVNNIDEIVKKTIYNMNQKKSNQVPDDDPDAR